MSNGVHKLRQIWREYVCKDAALSHVTFRVAFVLSGFVNANSGIAWPSITTLANTLGIASKTVRRSIRALELHGYLDVTRKARKGPTNQYRLLLPDAMGDNSGHTRGQIQPEDGDTGVPQYKRKIHKNISAHPNSSADETFKFKVAPGNLRRDRTRLELEIAKRLGSNGIDTLAGLPSRTVEDLCVLQSTGRLSDQALFDATLAEAGIRKHSQKAHGDQGRRSSLPYLPKSGG